MHTVFSALMALLLPCAGMALVFIIYMCAFCYAASRHPPPPPPPQKGLAAEDLNKLPKVSGKDLYLVVGSGTDCAVCLDEIEDHQSVRMVPGCNHGFHLQCGDTWLSNHAACPVCRLVVLPELILPSTDHNLC